MLQYLRSYQLPFNVVWNIQISVQMHGIASVFKPKRYIKGSFILLLFTLSHISIKF
jgi:hypothetical protein